MLSSQTRPDNECVFKSSGGFETAQRWAPSRIMHIYVGMNRPNPLKRSNVKMAPLINLLRAAARDVGAPHKAFLFSPFQHSKAINSLPIFIHATCIEDCCRSIKYLTKSIFSETLKFNPPLFL